MRYAIAFLSGAIVGAFVLFLYLQETGRAVAAPSGPEERATSRRLPADLPVSTSDAPAKPVLPRQVVISEPGKSSRTVVTVPLVDPGVPSYDVVVIPVAGVQKKDLRNTYLQARGSRIHHAIDILAPRGTPVLATVDGVVMKIFESKQGGHTVYLSDPRKEWVHYYAHLDRYAPGLREGMQVRQGQLIGYVGISGNAPPDTPHLHFSIEKLSPTKEWWKTTPTDPFPILVQRGVTFDRPVQGGAAGGR